MQPKHDPIGRVAGCAIITVITIIGSILFGNHFGVSYILLVLVGGTTLVIALFGGKQTLKFIRGLFGKQRIL